MSDNQQGSDEMRAEAEAVRALLSGILNRSSDWSAALDRCYRFSEHYGVDRKLKNEFILHGAFLRRAMERAGELVDQIAADYERNQPQAPES